MINTAVFGVLVSGLLTGASLAGDHTVEHHSGTAHYSAQAKPADNKSPDDDQWG